MINVSDFVFLMFGYIYFSFFGEAVYIVERWSSIELFKGNFI